MKKLPFRSAQGLLALLLGLFICACVGRKSQPVVKEEVKVVKLPKVDGQYLFNGNNLDGWEITSFGTEGPVDVYDGKVILNYGDGCTGVNWKGDFPKVNYEVFLEARKTSGNDFFCGMTFPVQDEFCSLIVGGWGGPVVGISCIDGKDASENETSKLKRFDKEVWYRIHLKVSDEKIEAWIDEESFVDFVYSERELYVRPEVERSKPFGICSWITTAELRNIWIRKLD